MFAEMLQKSEEKIFLEAIDQFFEDESSECVDYPLNNADIEFSPDIEKMNGKFCDSLLDDESFNLATSYNRDVSTEYDSEENSIKILGDLKKNKKLLFISDVLFINKENINKTKARIFQQVYRQIKIKENKNKIMGQNKK